MTCSWSGLDDQLVLAKKVTAELCEKHGVEEIVHLYGTVIEFPRAASATSR